MRYYPGSLVTVPLQCVRDGLPYGIPDVVFTWRLGRTGTINTVTPELTGVGAYQARFKVAESGMVYFRWYSAAENAAVEGAVNIRQGMLEMLVGLQTMLGSGSSSTSAAGLLAGSYTNAVAYGAADNSLVIRHSTDASKAYYGILTGKFAFTRSTSGTYVGSDGLVKTAAVDTPRIEYDQATLELKGLLIEPAGTNYCWPSIPSLSPAWSVDNSGAVSPTVTDNYAAAPDGTMTATRVQLNKTGGTFSRLQRIIAASSDRHLGSVWMKTTGGGTSNVGLRLSSDGVNCVVTGVWKRFWVLNAFATTSPDLQILLFDSIAGNDETADILVWGAQVEASSSGAITEPTSYIPCTTANGTRGADACSMASSSAPSFLTSCSIYAEYSCTNTNYGVIGYDDGTTSNRAELRRSQLIVSSGGVNTATPITGGAGADQKVYAACADNDFQTVRNGSLVASDTSGAMPASSTTIRLGSIFGSANFGSLWIKSALIVNQRVSNADMQAATA